MMYILTMYVRIFVYSYLPQLMLFHLNVLDWNIMLWIFSCQQ